MQTRTISRITSLVLILFFLSSTESSLATCWAMEPLAGSSSVLPGRPTPEPILITAKGKGTMKIGRETFQITSVVVKLLDDRTVELTLVADITFFLSGRWTVDSASPKTYNLEITGSMTGGGAQGTGKVVVRDDGKSLDRLSAQGGLKTSTRKVAIEFVAAQ
jgi:hypothetical protein